MTQPTLTKTHRWPPDLYERVEALSKELKLSIQGTLNHLITLGIASMEAPEKKD